MMRKGWTYEHKVQIMDVSNAVQERRARRALDTKPVEREMVDTLVEAIRLAPSCNNNQPWRVIVARTPESLGAIKAHLPKGNSWATRSPLIFVVSARPEDDCRQSDRRDYFMFGCGLAVGQLTLRATELGLIAHPISGYEPLLTKQALGIPDEYLLVALVICGYPGNDTSLLSEKQLLAERERPPRKAIEDTFFEGVWGLPLQS
jgi:glutaredoxin-dependent peroxiredoxin